MNQIVCSISIIFLLVNNMINKMFEKMQQMKATMDDLKKDLLLSEELYKSRLDICDSCEYIYRPTFSCKKCGCFIKVKAKFPPMKCPIGKWSN